MGLVEFMAFWDTLVRQFNATFIVNNRYMWFVLGFKNTMLIVVGAAIIGIIVGNLVAMVRVYHSQTGNLKILDKLCGAYLAVFRGTPIVVQLLIMYYIILVSIKNSVLIATITFGVNSGAYVAEIVRAGILSVDIGQTEAGRSLGLPSGKTMRLIILPQAIINILPALGNEFITLIKETSVAGYVTVLDFTRAGEYIRSRTLDAFFSLFFVAIVYFILIAGLTKVLRNFERRLRQSDRS